MNWLISIPKALATPIPSAGSARKKWQIWRSGLCMHVIDLVESSIGWKDKFPILQIGKAYEVAKSIGPARQPNPSGSQKRRLILLISWGEPPTCTNLRARPFLAE